MTTLHPLTMAVLFALAVFSVLPLLEKDPR